MADHVPHWTPRLKLHYTVAGFTHDLVVRAVRDLPFVADDHIDKLEGFLGSVTSLMYDDFDALGYSYADQDMPFFTDLTRIPDVVGTASSAGRSVTQRTVQTRWESRSALNGKGAIVLFGLNFNLVSDTEFLDFRKTAAEDAVIEGSIASLNIAPFWACGDGFPAIWKNYVNVKMNDAALQKARRG